MKKVVYMIARAIHQRYPKIPEAEARLIVSSAMMVNPVIDFITDRCRIAKGVVYTEAPKLYAAYKEWCGSKGYAPMTNHSFYDALRRAGVAEDRKTSGLVFMGLHIVEK